MCLTNIEVCGFIGCKRSEEFLIVIHGNHVRQANIEVLKQNTKSEDSFDISDSVQLSFLQIDSHLLGSTVSAALACVHAFTRYCWQKKLLKAAEYQKWNS